MELSVVVPVYRSSKNAILHLPQIMDILRHKYKDFEVLFIIDYHDMNVEMKLFISICNQYNEIKVHFLKKNYGQHFATLCGYYLAKGDFIACIDEDMSEYVLEICKTNSYKNTDVFYFYYDKNQMYNSPIRKFFSILYKFLINKIVNLKRHSTFRIISKSLRDKLLIDKHYYWNLDVMIFNNTNKIGGTTILNCKITDENSTYNYIKLFKIAFEIAYENNPVFINILFAFLPSILFYLSVKNLAITVLFYVLIVVIASVAFMFIKYKTISTIQKILQRLK